MDRIENNNNVFVTFQYPMNKAQVDAFFCYNNIVSVECYADVFPSKKEKKKKLMLFPP